MSKQKFKERNIHRNNLKFKNTGKPLLNRDTNINKKIQRLTLFAMMLTTPLQKAVLQADISNQNRYFQSW